MSIWAYFNGLFDKKTDGGAVIHADKSAIKSDITWDQKLVHEFQI